jgi:hypothetical protein
MVPVIMACMILQLKKSMQVRSLGPVGTLAWQLVVFSGAQIHLMNEGEDSKLLDFCRAICPICHERETKKLLMREREMLEVHDEGSD